MYPSSHQLSGNTPEVSLLAVKRLDRLHSRTALLRVCHHFLPLLHSNGVLILVFFFLILCGVSVQVFVHVCVQAKNSNGTTVRMFSKFNLLCGCCTLLPFPSILTSLCTPGNINVLGQSFVSCLSIPCLH